MPKAIRLNRSLCRLPDTMSVRSVANDAVMLVFFGCQRDLPPKLEAIRFPAS